MAAQMFQGTSRPIANFHPNHWTDHVQSLHPHDQAIHSEKKGKELEELREEAKKEVSAKKENPVEELKVIDVLERLGIAYHFENEIEEILQRVYESNKSDEDDYDLNLTSLKFRILRQHGYRVPCDVFSKFKDEDGGFKESLKSDVEGMLSLYEACHVRKHGDELLDEALKFTTTFLQSIVESLRSPLKEKVEQALRQPLHKGIPRLETRHFISIYDKDPSHNHIFLRFAKLDFNFLQSLHINELKDFARWWKSVHVKASFSRDRFAEAYFWIVGTYFEPKYKSARKAFIKLFKIASLLDDTCDAYATFQEIQLLNQAIQRWDRRCTDELPEHVRWTYQAILEASEEVEQELAKEGRSLCINYVIEQIKLLGKGYEQEAKWCNEGYVPTYDEYMKNAVITSPYPSGIVASMLGMKEANKEDFEWVTQNPLPKSVIAASTIMRLLNDVYGHKFEQTRSHHVASVVECYMERHGLPREENAYEEVLKHVESAWKDINEAILEPYAIPKPVLTRILNLARVANEIYKGEDGYTIVSPTMKDKVAAVLFDHIPL